MALTTTVAAVKSGLIDEIRNLGITSYVSEATQKVQVTYAAPPAQQHRKESVHFSEELQTISDPEYRLNAGRRRRYLYWELELLVNSVVTSDSEDAETRAFAIAGQIESFLASNSQPGEWPNSPVTSGALSLLVTGMRSELLASVEGEQATQITMTLELKEYLT